MKNVIYVAKADLPYTAAGIRIDGIARILEELQYTVTVICDKEFDAAVKEQVQLLGAEVVLETADVVEVRYHNRTYVYRPFKKANKMHAIFNLIELRFAKKLFSIVKKYCKKIQPSIIVLYNDTYGLTKRLIPYGRRKNIKLFADVTEWYEKKEYPKNIAERMIPTLVDKRIRKLDRKLKGVISISPYLHEYYQKNNIPSVFIPPLMPEFYQQPNVQNKTATVVYAGSPGEKDLLLPAVEAIRKVNSKEVRLHLKLIGVSLQYMESLCKDLDFEKYGIEVYGRLPHTDTLRIIDEADYGILMRQNKRYAKAGFSTKMSECMSRSVPMICNRVGGCDSVIENNVDGFIIEEATAKDLETIFSDIANMSQEARMDMKRKAYAKACNLFNGKSYTEKIKHFLEI